MQIEIWYAIIFSLLLFLFVLAIFFFFDKKRSIFASLNWNWLKQHGKRADVNSTFLSANLCVGLSIFEINKH